MLWPLEQRLMLMQCQQEDGVNDGDRMGGRDITFQAPCLIACQHVKSPTFISGTKFFVIYTFLELSVIKNLSILPYHLEILTHAMVTGGQVVTVFSAPDYPQFQVDEDRYRNKAAIAILGPPNYDAPTFKQFEAALPRPQVRLCFKSSVLAAVFGSNPLPVLNSGIISKTGGLPMIVCILLHRFSHIMTWWMAVIRMRSLP